MGSNNSKSLKGILALVDIGDPGEMEPFWGCGDTDFNTSGECAVEFPESASVLWNFSESGELSSSRR